MAQITIQISDELAQRLESLQNYLPEALARLADNLAPPSKNTALLSSLIVPNDIPVYQEVLDFLIASPTPEAITKFKVSPAAQARLRELLDSNRETTLNENEAIELDLYEQLDQLMTLLKARAYKAQNSSNQ